MVFARCGRRRRGSLRVPRKSAPGRRRRRARRVWRAARGGPGSGRGRGKGEEGRGKGSLLLSLPTSDFRLPTSSVSDLTPSRRMARAATGGGGGGGRPGGAGQ